MQAIIDNSNRKAQRKAMVNLLSLVVNKDVDVAQQHPLSGGRMDHVLQGSWQECVDTGLGAEAWLVLSIGRAAA